ncbi:Threonine/homoserine efflux transporter RhtA [Colwellia chukchiensis]|uniref:Threonine/homoserine efflux transporter RhtA n=1 Tax=Colwellia chukchiensis TaxID=641665 RepID=A0A1H7QCA1_9GAMM|nr:DMT family transporter [Colwellia chukchiensis]SEL45730.1 Threonine/homoserine efflux transporter RhtA [Colwellia chukchiensis]
MTIFKTKPRNGSIELLFLAAIWGASFLFMRIGAPEFGAIVFTTLRTGIAALFLLSCLAIYKQTNGMQGHWRDIFVVGAFNTAIPFCLFAYAALTLSAGTTSVLNATAPMFAAIVGYLWLKDSLTLSASLGLCLGFFGVYLLVFEHLHLDSNAIAHTAKTNALLPTLAAMLAALCYGFAANYTKKYLANIKPLALATGSQIAATAMLLPLSIFFLPETLPSDSAISAVVLIGVICTGIAYILFFRLLAHLGPAKAISVTYLIPAFGIIWGAIFLAETISLMMLIGASVILLGVALTTGLIKGKTKAVTDKTA